MYVLSCPTLCPFFHPSIFCINLSDYSVAASAPNSMWFPFCEGFSGKAAVELPWLTHTHNTAKAAICWPVHHRHIRVELINGTSQLDTFGKTLTRGISIYTIFDILRRKEIISCNERTFHISSVDTEISSNDAKPKKWHIVDMTRVLHF